MGNLDSMFFRRVPAKVIIQLKYGGSLCNTTKIGRTLNISYMMVRRVLTKMVEYGVVTKSREGRCTYYELTEKGVAIADALQTLFNIFAVETEKKRPETPLTNFGLVNPMGGANLDS